MLYWTFLGLSVPYEKGEWSCVFLHINLFYETLWLCSSIVAAVLFVLSRLSSPSVSYQVREGKVPGTRYPPRSEHPNYLQETGSVVILEQYYVYSAYMPLAFEQFFSNYLREIRDQHSSSSSSNLNF